MQYQTSENRPFISIVVCSYNGEKRIADCLNSLLIQTYPKDLYEIVVVDDCSTDKTKEVVQSFPVTLVSNPVNTGLSEARNVGIRNSKGSIIAFTDDDCVADPKWIETIEPFHKDLNLCGVGGNIIPNKDPNSILLSYLAEKNPLSPVDESVLKSQNLFYRLFLYLKRTIFPFEMQKDEQYVYALIGANMSFRREILESVNFFDKTMGNTADEEDLCKRIRRAHPDKKFLYTNSAVINHIFDPSLKKSLKRSHTYGSATAKMFYKYKDHNPIIYPFPVLFALLVLVMLPFYPFNLLIPFLPIALYPYWIINAFKKSDISQLKFAYVQLLHDWYSNLGFLYGFIKFKDVFAQRI